MFALLSYLRSHCISRTTRPAHRRCFPNRPTRPRSVRLRLEQLEDRITPTGPTITALASFGSTDQNASSLIVDGSGNLYGTQEGDGSSNFGTIFKLAKGSNNITTLASFSNDPNGTLPEPSGVVMDSSGNLYGTTAYEGASDDGTIFKLAPGGTIDTLATFNGTNGSGPRAGLIMDSSGNLYGTTEAGGPSYNGTTNFGYGTIFEWVKSSGTIKTLASFNGTNGSDPFAGLTMDSSGNLYGTTLGAYDVTTGGIAIEATLYEWVKSSGTIKTLATFSSNSGGELIRPSGVVMDSSGNLYGTTELGGSSGLGSVFEWVKSSNTLTTRYSFTGGTDGIDPWDGLVLDSSGNLYGTTAGGFPGPTPADTTGTVFELTSSGTFTTLATFNGTDGANPMTRLSMDSSGNLYGTTTDGGNSTSNTGTIFEVQGAVVVPTDQWTGANSAVDTNWSDGKNWSLGTAPTAGQTVLFTNNSSVKALTSTVDSGFTSAIGNLTIDSTWGGTITVNNPLTVAGNFTLVSGTFGGSGAVTIAGSKSTWTGGTIDVGSGGFTNNGTLTYSGSNNVILNGSGSLINNKSFVQTGTGTLKLENGATLNNAKGATYNIENTGGISQSGGGTFLNAGTLEKTKGTGTATIATTTLNNTGTVKDASGTLDISATVSQVSGSTLTAGTWSVNGTATVTSTLDITSASNFTTIGTAAHVTMSGPHTTFSNLSGLATIDKGGSFSLLGGQSFITKGALSNNGSITLSPASILTVSGSFTQSSTATLAIQLGGTNSAPTFGQLVSTTGSVTLAGKLSVTSTVVPAVGSSFAVLDNEGNSAISGTFANLPEGATFTVKAGGTSMTFKISYAGSDGDGSHNVILTRTA